MLPSPPKLPDYTNKNGHARLSTPDQWDDNEVVIEEGEEVPINGKDQTEGLKALSPAKRKLELFDPPSTR